MTEVGRTAGGGGEWAATNRMSIGLEYPFVDLGGEDRSITFFGDVTPEIRIRARHHPSEAECEVLTNGLDGEKAQARLGHIADRLEAAFTPQARRAGSQKRFGLSIAEKLPLGFFSSSEGPRITWRPSCYPRKQCRRSPNPQNGRQRPIAFAILSETGAQLYRWPE
jgi:hypothetical protein